eukprot:TRINITY_DN17444_c0_g2_i2.p1 TRINITY_DN17444_c0_g2~~TRINITY_DN17444_c0_g2_i2.p1  ORF type:complete len:244 (-),score=10.93 TRINITY_DN17444_c0_g2_i2:345-1076(-)
MAPHLVRAFTLSVLVQLRRIELYELWLQCAASTCSFCRTMIRVGVVVINIILIFRGAFKSFSQWKWGKVVVMVLILVLALHHHVLHATRVGARGHVLLGEFELDRLAHATEFDFGVEGKPVLAGLPAGVLKLNIIVDGNTLRTRACYGSGPIFSFQPLLQAMCVRLSLDVASADQTMVMSCNGASITLDGCWRSSTIGSSLETLAQQGHYQPCLCVLVLKEDESRSTDREGSSLLATSFHVSA